MTYEPTQWKAGDTVTSAKLNKIEQGIAGAGGANILVAHCTTVPDVATNGLRAEKIDQPVVPERALDCTLEEILNADFTIIQLIYASETSGTITMYDFINSIVESTPGSFVIPTSFNVPEKEEYEPLIFFATALDEFPTTVEPSSENDDGEDDLGEMK